MLKVIFETFLFLPGQFVCKQGHHPCCMEYFLKIKPGQGRLAIVLNSVRSKDLTAGIQAEQVTGEGRILQGIRLVASMVPAALFIVCVCAMRFYPITRVFNERMQEELASRRLMNQNIHNQL